MCACRPVLMFAMVLASCHAGGPEQDVDTSYPEEVPDPDETPASVVQVDPEAFDLGAMDPRCPVDLEVSLSASGAIDPGLCTVTAPEGWTVSPESFELSSGERRSVQLSWDGSLEDPSGELHFDFEEHESLSVPLAALPELPQDSVSVDLGRRSDADLLLVVDRSCNMDDMALLEPSWPVFRSHLADSGIALRMASVVEDDGCVLGDPVVLDGSLSDEAFRAALWSQQNWSGSWGIYTEKLLALASIALSAECNAELVQGSAPLHVLAFSDEPDQSDMEWSAYVEQMALHTEPGVPFTVHGIGKDSEECQIAQWYTGVLEATESTGGVFLDFCTEDWDAALTELADGIVEASRRVVLASLPEFEGELQTVSTGAGELTGWSLEDDHIRLPPDAELEGELTLLIRPEPICGE